MKTALLVIDVQSYFLSRSPKDLPARIAKHIQNSHYDYVAFTIFHNPEGSNWEKSLQWIKARNDEDMILPTEFSGLIQNDNVFKKETYSALKVQELSDNLQEKEIERIELCGIDTDACVLATAYDAFDSGYKVKILPSLSFSRADLQSAAESIADRNLNYRDTSAT